MTAGHPEKCPRLVSAAPQGSMPRILVVQKCDRKNVTTISCYEKMLFINTWHYICLNNICSIPCRASFK